MVDYKELALELANFETAGVTITDIIADPDPILRKRGDDARIFEDIMSDAQVTQAVLNRKNRVLLDDDYQWTAGNPQGDTPSEDAERLRDSLVADLENVNMTEVISAILDAPYYGFTPIEIFWRGAKNRWQIKDLSARPNHWFKFAPEGLSFNGEIGSNKNLVPAGKILLARHHPKYENPYGIRLLSRCLWPVIFKKAGVKFYAQFIERYGLPSVFATAAQNATATEKQEAATNLSQLRQGGSGVVPFGTDVTLVSAGSHHADIHERYLAYWNAEISKVLMGQTLTAELSGETGSYAAAETHKEVGGDIAKADRKMVTQAMNELAWIYAQINAPHVPAPIFSFGTPEDLSARADLDGKLYSMGVDFNESYIEKTYGLSRELFSIRPRVEASTAEPFSFAAFASSGSEPAADELAALKLEKLLSKDAEAVMEKITEAKDLEEVQEILTQANYGNEEIEKILNAVLINGVGAGMAGV